MAGKRPGDDRILPEEWTFLPPFYWWKKQHGDWIIQNNQETAADNGIRWIQAEIGGLSPAPEPEVSIHLRSGDRIEVYDSRRTDADWLQQISRGLLR